MYMYIYIAFFLPRPSLLPLLSWSSLFFLTFCSVLLRFTSLSLCLSLSLPWRVCFYISVYNLPISIQQNNLTYRPLICILQQDGIATSITDLVSFSCSSYPQTHTRSSYNEAATLLLNSQSATVLKLLGLNTPGRFGFFALALFWLYYYFGTAYTAGAELSAGMVGEEEKKNRKEKKKLEMRRKAEPKNRTGKREEQRRRE